MIALTASGPAELDEESGRAGFGDRAGKPMRKEMLLDALRLGLGAAAAPARADGAPGVPAEILDLGILRSFGEDVGEEAFPALLETFLEEMRGWLDACPVQLRDGALDAVERTAHNIKSCAGTLGAGSLRARAEALERSARDGGERAPDLVARMLDAAAPALAAIEAVRAD